jgi:hypothetical protein
MEKGTMRSNNERGKGVRIRDESRCLSLTQGPLSLSLIAALTTPSPYEIRGLVSPEPCVRKKDEPILFPIAEKEESLLCFVDGRDGTGVG